MIIVIDGPAGSGKSSTAKAVADRMNIEYLDSGALYRAVTLLFLNCDRQYDVFFSNLASDRFRFRYKDGTFRVWLDEEEVTRKIRSDEVTNYVSQVAAQQKVRAFVNDLMHRAVEKRTFIADGRDLGTAVFPGADLKFFMTADVDTRAQRRYEELMEKGHEVEYQEVRRNIQSRDAKDARREADPLKKADDAITIDTSSMTFEQQVQKICSYISGDGQRDDLPNG